MVFLLVYSKLLVQSHIADGAMTMGMKVMSLAMRWKRRERPALQGRMPLKKVYRHQTKKDQKQNTMSVLVMEKSGDGKYEVEEELSLHL